MPTSRKRAKGKERKLKQQARQSVSSSSSSPSSSPAVGGDNISLPEQNVRLTAEQAKNIKCPHACIRPPRGHPVGDFIHTFQEGCALEGQKLYIVDAMEMTFEKHEDVWKDSTLRKMVINIMLWIGTNFLLEDFCIAAARNNSEAIILLENYDGEGNFYSAFFKATQDYSYMLNAEDRDVVRFYYKRIPCSCLDKLYSKIKKSQDRGGQCDHCKQICKRKDLKTCSRCNIVLYCSKECQTSHWPEHKDLCMKVANIHDIA